MTRKFWCTALLTTLLVLGAALLHRQQTFLQDTTNLTLAQYAARKRTSIQSYLAYLNLPATARRHWERFIDLPTEQRDAYYAAHRAEIDAAAAAMTDRFKE